MEAGGEPLVNYSFSGELAKKALGYIESLREKGKNVVTRVEVLSESLPQKVKNNSFRDKICNE